MRFEAPLLHPFADSVPFGVLALAVWFANEGSHIRRLLPKFDFAQRFTLQPLVVRSQCIAAGCEGDDSKNEVSAY